MNNNIKPTTRPIIPCEHPSLLMRLNLFKENLIRLKHKKNRYKTNDTAIKTLFSDTTELKHQCESLVQYVAEAFEHYALWDYTHAYYPGRPSQQSARVDAMEGCSRVIPTLAAWIHQNKTKSIPSLSQNGKALDVTHWLKQAFLAGTSSSHPGYWGKLGNYDQRICESADLALALWLSRQYVWDTFNESEKQQVVNWFQQVNDCQTVDNNWHLFPLTVQLVIKALTGNDHVQQERYTRTKEFYVGEGWFRDGAKGNFDFYNAWGFHYSLYWLDQIDPEFDPEFIRTTMREFCNSYLHLFTPKGLPLFGRSACYRLSVAAPLLASLDSPPEDGNALCVGQVKRAFRTSLDYFIANGALEYGSPTQGVFADDARLVDNYSGPASSFWSLRALNVAIYCGDRIGLWDAEEAPLPIEQADYQFKIESINALVIGTQETQEVVVIFQDDYTQEQDPISRRLESQSRAKKLLEVCSGRAERPKNNLLRKGLTCYSSKMNHLF